MSDDININVAKMQVILENIKDDTTAIKKTLEKHNDRLFKVETFVTRATAVVAFVGAGAASLLTVVIDVLKGKLGS